MAPDAAVPSLTVPPLIVVSLSVSCGGVGLDGAAGIGDLIAVERQHATGKDFQRARIGEGGLVVDLIVGAADIENGGIGERAGLDLVVAGEVERAVVGDGVLGGNFDRLRPVIDGI